MIPAPGGYQAVFTDTEGNETRRAPVLAWGDDGDPLVLSVPVPRELIWAGYSMSDGVTCSSHGNCRKVHPGGHRQDEVFARVEGPTES